MKKLLFFLLVIAKINFTYAVENESEHLHESHASEDKQSLADHKDSEQSQKNTVGADKGILEANEKDGIKLSQESEKKFEIQRVKVDSALVEIPKTAVLSTGLEKNIYRYRNGFYRRVDFEIKKKTLDKIQIQSNDLKINDEIVTFGTGFIRIAELAVFDTSEGHSH